MLSLPIWPYGVLLAIPSYLLLCRVLRYQRCNQKHAKYPYPTRESFSSMSNEHAFEIIQYVNSLEFPYVVEKAIQFALFKTYGFPSMSKLLCETRQLSKPQFVGKRYADTTILITEFLSNAPDSDRACSAIARMNYLHSKYQAVNKISNNDMLYTLALFVLEVERWVNAYEWRGLTDMEVCAFGTQWKSIGDAMGIDFSPLASGPDKIRDGFQFARELREWSLAYEKKGMVPHRDNHELAEQTIGIILCKIPSFIRHFAKQVVITLMGDRLRKAMMYDLPSENMKRFVDFALNIRKLVLRHLALPRPYFLRYSTISENAHPKTGRYYQTIYEAEPWYIPNTLRYRWEPAAWLRWMLGMPYPKEEKFKPQGYHIFEVGPRMYDEKGWDACGETRDRLMTSGRSGCPFAFK